MTNERVDFEGNESDEAHSKDCIHKDASKDKVMIMKTLMILKTLCWLHDLADLSGRGEAQSQ